MIKQKGSGKKALKCRAIVAIFVLFMVIFLIIIFLVLPYINIFFIDPFFWALISMFALIGSSVTLCTKQLGRYPILNMILVAIFALGRFVLVLPFCTQPRFHLFHWHMIVGFIIFITGLIFLIPLIQIKPWPAPDGEIYLKTTGFYGFVRNPIYLGEILWSLGWAIIFRSVIGVALISLWWTGFLFHIILEEEELERKLSRTYIDYKSRVQGRILPGLPV